MNYDADDVDRERKFRARLRGARSDLRLTQVKLATLAGLNPQVVAHYESGYRFPSVHSLIRLASALGVTLDYLLGLTDHEPARSLL